MVADARNAHGEKRCTQCRVLKIIEEFPAQLLAESPGRCTFCLRGPVETLRDGGTAAMRLDDMVQMARARLPAVPTQQQRLVTRGNGLRQYGMTLQDYERMLQEQYGRCALCGTPEEEARTHRRTVHPLQVDHDHETGRVRGLLCGHCNRGLAFFRDNPTVLALAAEYVQERARPH